MRLGALLVSVLTVLSACSPAERRSYQLHGQVLAVDRANQTLSIAHEDIPGFMPGMTMAFPVERADLLEAAAPGDFVRATLVVDDARVRLTEVTVTGHGPLPERTAAPVFDVLEPGQAVPDLEVTDQLGRARQLADWKGRAIAVTFVYTRCPLPDFCPAMDRRFAAVQQAIAARPALRDRIHLVSVTVDPEYDTPEVLAPHADALHADPEVWSFVTGDRAALDAFGRRFGVSVMPGDPASREREIVHNLSTAVIDPAGRLVTIHSGRDWTADQLVSELERAAAAR